MITSFRDAIARWPSISDFAEDIGVSENTAKQMRTRNSIPAPYWLNAASAAKRREIDGVSIETFAALMRDRAVAAE